jgi:hypothetical protein
MRIFLLLSLSLLACERGPSKSGSSESEPVRVCSKEGQSCLHSEGKLGLCTAKLGTSGGPDGGPSLVCMSLH